MGIHLRRRAACGLGILAATAVVTAGCAAIREAHVETVNLVRQNLDTMFASTEGRLGEEDLRQCLAAREEKTLPELSAKPVFKGNHFLSCAANDVVLLGKLYRPESRFVLVFEVNAPVRKPPPGKEVMSAVGAKTVWAFRTNCAFIYEGGKFTPYKNKGIPGLLEIKAVPDRIPRGSACLDMPNASLYVSYQRY